MNIFSKEEIAKIRETTNNKYTFSKGYAFLAIICIFLISFIGPTYRGIGLFKFTSTNNALLFAIGISVITILLYLIMIQFQIKCKIRTVLSSAEKMNGLLYVDSINTEQNNRLEFEGSINGDRIKFYSNSNFLNQINLNKRYDVQYDKMTKTLLSVHEIKDKL